MVLKAYPNVFTKHLVSFFKPLKDQGCALVDIDDNLLFLNTKEHMFEIVEQLCIISTKHSLKLAPENSFFRSLTVKFIEHGIGYNTIKPIHSKFAAFHQFASTTGKVALLSF